MIDVEIVDKIYEAGRVCGVQTVWRLFDKALLFPLAMVPQAVANETSETITEDALRTRAAEGWFPLLKGAGFERDQEGAPGYAPSRIGLFLKLERKGYGADELRLIAEREEWAIDNVYTTDDLAYIDDDLDALIMYETDRLDAFESCLRSRPNSAPNAEDKEIEEMRGRLRFLAKLKEQGIPDKLREKIAKYGFRVKAFNDAMRCWLLEQDRAKIQADYSPVVCCRSHSWSPDEGFKAGPIRWEDTIRGSLEYGQPGEVPAIRVPGFILRGDVVLPTRTLRPADYATLWKQHDLDDYLTTSSRLRGERCCSNCFAPLETVNERRRFCTERCRSAARQRRFRERNPEAVERTQKRYWDSVDLEER